MHHSASAWLLPVLPIMQAALVMVLILVMMGIRRRRGLPPVGIVYWLILAAGVPALTTPMILFASDRPSSAMILFPPCILVAGIVYHLSLRKHGADERGDAVTRKMSRPVRRRILAFTLITLCVLVMLALMVAGTVQKGIHLNILDWICLSIYVVFFLITTAFALRLSPRISIHLRGTTPRPFLASTLFLVAAIALLISMCGPATHHSPSHPALPLLFTLFTLKLALRCRGQDPEPPGMNSVEAAGP